MGEYKKIGIYIEGIEEFPRIGNLWDGEVNSYRRPNGKGHLIFSEESRWSGMEYNGYMKDGIMHGKGTMTWPKGTRFEGTWEEGKAIKGTMFYTNGNKYTGEVYFDQYGRYYKRRPKLSGRGTMFYENGNRYEGLWNNGGKTQGTMFYTDGNRYEGEWSKGKKEGFGIQYYVNGERYEGTWSEDMRHGKGCYYYGDGSRYDGEWQNDMRNGKGTLYYPDGSKKEGMWQNNEFKG